MDQSKAKPLFDEQALARVLEAAYILQEHRQEIQKLSAKHGLAGRPLAGTQHVTSPQSAAPSAGPMQDSESSGAKAPLAARALPDSGPQDSKSRDLASQHSSLHPGAKHSGSQDPARAVRNDQPKAAMEAISPEKLFKVESLTAEDADVLKALESLQPSLSALVEKLPSLSSKNARPADRHSGNSLSHPLSSEAALESDVADGSQSALCGKCGHQLVAEEQFCGKCGTARSSPYQPPSMQSKVAALWLMQEAQKQNAAVAASNGSISTRPEVIPHRSPKGANLPEMVLGSSDASTNPAATNQFPTFPPTDAIADSDLPDLFAMPEIKHALAALAQEAPLVADPSASAEAVSDTELPAPALLPTREMEDDLAAELAADAKTAEHTQCESSSLARVATETTSEDAKLERKIDARGAWTSAARARAFLEQFADSSNRSAFMRFWNSRRGDIYLAVALVLVGGVIRWALWSNHAASVNAAATTSHVEQTDQSDPSADLSLFDRMLISLGLAEAPEAPKQYQGNPATQVWVDTHTALYYCPGAELYGKTPQGRLTTQRDAQLDSFEPAFRRACD